jgi:trehalose 6-phosphate synthase/phosphatase
MDQKEDAPAVAHSEVELEQPIPTRPGVPDRTDTSLPPHLRASVTNVPVTPGITREAYESETSSRSGGAEGPQLAEAGGYFSRREVDHAIAASPAPDTTNQTDQSFQSKVDSGAQQGKDFLRRLSVAALGSGPIDSLSDIRAAHPDLALTGNIISATFNIPHSLKYRKGADWVCTISSHFRD